MLINKLCPQMSLKTSPYVETLYARASRAKKRDGLALPTYISLVRTSESRHIICFQFHIRQSFFQNPGLKRRVPFYVIYILCNDPSPVLFVFNVYAEIVIVPPRTYILDFASILIRRFLYLLCFLIRILIHLAVVSGNNGGGIRENNCLYPLEVFYILYIYYLMNMRADINLGSGVGAQFSHVPLY